MAQNSPLDSALAIALGITDRVWTIADLVDAALATDPAVPETSRCFRVIEGGRYGSYWGKADRIGRPKRR
jgi:hypothetical protein